MHVLFPAANSSCSLDEKHFFELHKDPLCADKATGHLPHRFAVWLSNDTSPAPTPVATSTTPEAARDLPTASGGSAAAAPVATIVKGSHPAAAQTHVATSGGVVVAPVATPAPLEGAAAAVHMPSAASDSLAAAPVATPTPAGAAAAPTTLGVTGDPVAAPVATPTLLKADATQTPSAAGGNAAPTLCAGGNEPNTRDIRENPRSGLPDLEQPKWKLLGVTSHCMFHGANVEVRGASGHVAVRVVARRLDGSWPAPSSVDPVLLTW
jgi:hypothetical protein